MQISTILNPYRWKLGFTMLLIFVEAILPIFFPLFIGFAIDDAIAGQHEGAISLGILGVVAMILGAGRRFFDSRLYAKIYIVLGRQAVDSIEDQPASVKSARLGMIKELVEFMENALPELISHVIGLVGVVIIIATLNMSVFWGSLIATVGILIIYLLSRRKTLRLNSNYNDVWEGQVKAIAANDSAVLDTNLKGLMKWNIKLSDLETLNFATSCILLMGFLVGAILLAAQVPAVQYGALLSLVMYVFQYMESVISLPMYYQNALRLKEILSRLKSI